MPRWNEIVNYIYEHLYDLAIECVDCKEPERAVSELPREPPEEIFIFDKCLTCMLNHVLDSYISLPRYYLSSPLHEVAIYILDDVVIELGEESGSMISKKKVCELLELLRDMGFDVSDLERYFRNSNH